MPESDVTLGELGRRLDAIAVDISSIRAEAVMRGEYETRLAAIDREIRDLKAENNRRDDKDSQAKQPWQSTLSAVINVAGFVLLILTLIFVAK